METNNFERQLPTGYRQALYINAKNTKFGLIMLFVYTAISLGATVMNIVLLTKGFTRRFEEQLADKQNQA